jgi:pimeloyl-ACP methyl ester carboxylesterase
MSRLIPWWCRRVPLVVAATLGVVACGGAGGGSGPPPAGEVLEEAFAPQVSATGPRGEVVDLLPATTDNLLFEVAAGGVVPPDAVVVAAAARPAPAGGDGEWWALLAVGADGASQVIDEHAGRAPYLSGPVPEELRRAGTALYLLRGRRSAEVRAAREHHARRLTAAALGGDWLRDRVSNLVDLLSTPWEWLDERLTDLEDQVVDLYADALDEVLDPLFAESDYFEEAVGHFLEPEVVVDPLGRQAPKVGQVPVVFIHGFTFLFPVADPEDQLDDLMEAMVDPETGVPGWDLRYRAVRYDYNPFATVKESGDDLAKELVKEGVVGEGDDLVIVGYSLGGIIGRRFDTVHGDRFRVRRLIMIASPSGGIPVDKMRDRILERAYDIGNPLRIHVPFGLATRTFLQTFWARTYGSADSMEDLEIGSSLLRSLAAPRQGYSAIAGVKVGGNVFLEQTAKVFHGAPNDGQVSVASVEAGVPPGADAKVTLLGGQRDYVYASHDALPDNRYVHAEVVRLLDQPLPEYEPLPDQ